MKTIAQQLNVTEFPFIIKDKNGNQIYAESKDGYWVKQKLNSYGAPIHREISDGFWVRWEYDSNGKVIYSESSDGLILDIRPKPCSDKVVEIDGIKYKLTAV